MDKTHSRPEGISFIITTEKKVVWEKRHYLLQAYYYSSVAPKAPTENNGYCSGYGTRSDIHLHTSSHSVCRNIRNPAFSISSACNSASDPRISAVAPSKYLNFLCRAIRGHRVDLVTVQKKHNSVGSSTLEY